MTDQPKFADGGIAPEGSPMPPVGECSYILPKPVTERGRGRELLRKINEADTET